MTRKEEIVDAAKKAAEEVYSYTFQGMDDLIGLFKAGAEWADEHPIHNEDVDLEKELKAIDDAFFDLDGVAVKAATSYLTVEDVKDIAKHFFNLGLKSKGEYIKGIPLNGWQIPCADPNYPCENPQMDCINCPRFGHPQGTITMTSMDEKESEQLVGKATFQTDSWSEIKEDK